MVAGAWIVRPSAPPALDAGDGRVGPAHDPARPAESGADVRRHFGRRGLCHRRRRAHLAGAQSWHPRRAHAGEVSGIRPMRAQDRHAPLRGRSAFSCKTIGACTGPTTRAKAGRTSPMVCRRTLVSRWWSTRTIPTASISCPIESDEFRCTPEGCLRVYRTRNAGESWEPLTRGLPKKGAYETVLRDAMTADSLDPVGIYFGTRSGQLYGSADEGKTWKKILEGLPPVVCVKSACGGAAVGSAVRRGKPRRTASGSGAHRVGRARIRRKR